KSKWLVVANLKPCEPVEPKVVGITRDARGAKLEAGTYCERLAFLVGGSPCSKKTSRNLDISFDDAAPTCKGPNLHPDRPGARDDGPVAQEAGPNGVLRFDAQGSDGIAKK